MLARAVCPFLRTRYDQTCRAQRNTATRRMRITQAKRVGRAWRCTVPRSPGPRQGLWIAVLVMTHASAGSGGHKREECPPLSLMLDACPLGGEGGIRTPGTFRYSRSPGVHLKPLGHLSACARYWPKVYRRAASDSRRFCVTAGVSTYKKGLWLCPETCGAFTPPSRPLCIPLLTICFSYRTSF